MKIYFSGIGGAGLGPLAHLALDCGYQVVGSDLQESLLTKELQHDGIRFSLDQSGKFLQQEYEQSPIDLYVYSSAVKEDNLEYQAALQLGIPTTKRSGLINKILAEKNLKLLAIAGTHGKTTTTAMAVWAFQNLGIPVSYSIGSTIPFGPSARYQEGSEWFVYECDEFDRNFLDFYPDISIITSLDYDHPDTYKSQKEYTEAFEQFVSQSSITFYWQDTVGVQLPNIKDGVFSLLPEEVCQKRLVGEHNRRNASLVAHALAKALTIRSVTIDLSEFPGSDRRFEKIAPNVYSDYAHHPAEIIATLQMARELSSHIVVVYQPHQNIRQYVIRDQYAHCFQQAKKVYWLPTYLSREDGREVLSASDLSENITKPPVILSDFNTALATAIAEDIQAGDIIVAMGAGSIDAWMRTNFGTKAKED